MYLSAWARVHDVTHADIDRTLYDDRSLVKHLAMRRTLWAVPTELLPVIQAAASDAVADTQRRRLAREGAQVSEPLRGSQLGPAWRGTETSSRLPCPTATSPVLVVPMRAASSRL